MALPGRVGYQVRGCAHGSGPRSPRSPRSRAPRHALGASQCSNYYRQLISRGAVKDPNYFIDDKGKAHYLFSTKKDADGNPVAKAVRVHARKGRKGDDDEDDDNEDDDDAGGAGSSSASKRKRGGGSSSAGGRGRGRGKKRDWDEDEDDLGDEWDLDNLDPERIQADQARYKNSQWRTTKRTRALMGEAADDAEEEQLRLDNPLPNHVDPITLEKVIKPAISPYGHVMRYGRNRLARETPSLAACSNSFELLREAVCGKQLFQLGAVPEQQRGVPADQEAAEKVRPGPPHARQHRPLPRQDRRVERQGEGPRVVGCGNGVLSTFFSMLRRLVLALYKPVRLFVRRIYTTSAN